jgi:hypothetical protein
MIIKLTKGLVTHVDPDDFLYLVDWCWQARIDPTTSTGFYAVRRLDKEQSTVDMRRVILINRGIDIESFQVDHKDGDSLNNRFSNLRRSTPAQNCWNRPIRSQDSERNSTPV